MPSNRLRIADRDNGRPVIEAAEAAAAEREEARRRGREILLVVMLTTVLGAAGVLVLVFVTMGFFLLVAAVALGFFVLGSIHYLLWGRLLERRVEAEDEGLDSPEEPGRARSAWRGQERNR